MANSGQSIQFFCSKCNTLLKETTSMDRPSHISEECPSCGCQLSETLQAQVKNPAGASSQLQSPFQTAYEVNARLALGIKEVDSFLALRLGDRLCIIGSDANLLVARLCIRALMSIRQGGIGAQSIVFVDAGNSSDIYQCVSFARQFGLEVQNVLKGIIVSRAFTIYQLAGVIAYELPKTIQRLGSKLVVISDLLRMFVQDPQVSKKEAEYLIGEIIESVRRINNALVVLSLHDESPYNSRVLPTFGKRIEIAKEEKQLGIRLHNNRKSQQVFVRDQELRLASLWR
ncbi:MAG: hypothetical protein MN733_39355 [Nitrososphaera sp.]|nr:hypothetical protein [Nitrososphaera sp.]